MILYLRRHADRLADRAERAYPGPLSDSDHPEPDVGNRRGQSA